MTINRANIGSLRTLNVTPYVNENNGISVAVPSAMSTGSPQISFTFSQATMSPYFSGTAQVLSYRSIYGTNVCAQNNSGASQTIYWQINKNGAQFKTGNTSVSNGNWLTVSLVDWTQDGNVYDFYVWCSTASLTLTYQNCWTQPSRVDTGAKIIKDLQVTVSNFVNYFTLTGKASSQWAGATQIPAIIEFDNLNYYSSASTPIATFNIPFLQVHPVYKLYVTQASDAGSTASSNLYNIGSSNSSNYPNMQQNTFVSSLSYRELFLR